MSEDYKQRVKDELAELSERLSKLVLFMGSEKAQAVEQYDMDLLEGQAESMLELQSILNQRIRRFQLQAYTMLDAHHILDNEGENDE